MPPARPQSWFQPQSPEPAQDPDRPHAGEDVFVRPFIKTGGRTRPLHDGLRVETLVQAQPAAMSAPLKFEERRIVELAQRPVSVAEIAAWLGVPLGVAQVLIADLYTGNYLSLHEPTELPTHVVERMRDLVRAL